MPTTPLTQATVPLAAYSPSGLQWWPENLPCVSGCSLESSQAEAIFRGVTCVVIMSCVTFPERGQQKVFDRWVDTEYYTAMGLFDKGFKRESQTRNGIGSAVAFAGQAILRQESRNVLVLFFGVVQFVLG